MFGLLREQQVSILVFKLMPKQKLKSIKLAELTRMPMQLYVNSQKVNLVEYTMPHQSGGGHWCSAGYRSKGTLRNYPAEDEEAIKQLESKGFSFDLIDLSDCPFSIELKARIKGISRTPALILDNKTKFEGIDRIREYIKSYSERPQENMV